MFGFLRRNKEEVVELATIYPNCPLECRPMTWVPKSRGEIIIRLDRMFVRQFFDCSTCGARARLSRAVDRAVWQFDTRVYS